MEYTHKKIFLTLNEAGTAMPLDLTASPQKNINKSVPLEIFQSFLDHRPHPPLRLLAPPHQLLAGKQLADPGHAHLLNQVVPALLRALPQHADQPQQEELVLRDPLEVVLLAEPLFLQQVLHLAAVVEDEGDDGTHVDVSLGGDVGRNGFGGLRCFHRRGRPPHSDAGAGLGNVFLLLPIHLFAEVGLEPLGELPGFSIVGALLFAFEHLLDALLDQCAAVIVVHYFIRYYQK